jgi:hypothetical protein
MRKETKSFKVEVKRRPPIASKKPRPFVPAEPAPTPQPAAQAFFKAPQDTPAPAPDPAAARRILPCLVTEAAMDAAKAEALSVAPIAPRPRGRPPKQRTSDDLAPLAPRKRGRPRKVQPVAERPAPAKAPTREVYAPQTASAAPVAPLPTTARSANRRTAVAKLPRSERWKRRLPKALR